MGSHAAERYSSMAEFKEALLDHVPSDRAPVTVVPHIAPYELVPGREARTMDELVRLCEQEWRTGVAHFYKGSLTEWLRGVAAASSDLVIEAAGPGAIPATAVQIRYARPDGRAAFAGARHWGVYSREIRRFDTLAEAPPAEVPVVKKTLRRFDRGKAPPAPVFGAVQPVWVTVHVPADAAAGDYRGTLSIQVNGERLAVPLALKVCGWTLPSGPARFAHANLYQSPDAVALHYKVPLWSDRHFELIGKSFALIRPAGSRVVQVPLICRGNLGNEQSMVRWIRKADGGYEHDFSVMEKYLDAAAKHLGKPKVVIFQVWEVYNTKGHKGALVTVLDRKTGKVKEMEGPKFGTAESLAFWKPVLAEIHKRMKRRGWLDAMVLGRGSDRGAGGYEAVALKTVLPDGKWTGTSHHAYKPSISTRSGSISVFYHEYVFPTGGVWFRFPHDPTCRRFRAWEGPAWVFYPRNDLRESSTLTDHRLLCERAISVGLHGFGRIGADFWPVLGYQSRPERGWVAPIRYPHASMGRLNVKYHQILTPGPDGPLATVRLETLRESVQECEARVFIEKAVGARPAVPLLGDDLARRAQALLDERTRLIRLVGMVTLGTQLWYPGSGWQERSKKLFSVAAEIAEALKK